MTTGRINQVPTVVGSLHTHTMNVCAIMLIPFSVCVAWLGLALLVWEGGGRRWPVPHTPSQPASPASNTHTNVFAFVCLLLFHIYILYMLHITQTDRHRSISLSLSLYIVLVLVACTLSHHHHHTTRAVRVYVCVCMCIWLPFEQCFRRPDNRPHNDMI